MVVLINAPLRLSTPTSDRKMPLGLLYIASYLRASSIDVFVLDLSILGLNRDQIIEEIKRLKPDIVGLNCLSLNVETVLNLAQTIKSNFPRALVVVGGTHPTLSGTSLLELSTAVDVLVFGEGEEPMLRLAQDPDRMEDIPGIAFRRNGKIIQTPRSPRIMNLDSLPFPAVDLLPLEKYWKREKVISLLASRGCPNKCIFCASPAIWGRTVTRRSPENVLKEIQTRIKEFDIRDFHFLDDEFLGWGEENLRIFCSGARELGIKWRAIGRIDQLKNYELIKTLAESGCYKLTFGIESGVQDFQRFMGKNIDLRIVPEIIHQCQGAGIVTKAYFMLGFPTEKLEEMLATINFAVSLKRVGLSDAVFLPLMPYYGTSLFRYLQKRDRTDLFRSRTEIADDWASSQGIVCEKLKKYSYYPENSANEFLDGKELRELIRYAYQRFYHEGLKDKFPSIKTLRRGRDHIHV